MGNIIEHKPVKLICSIIYKDKSALESSEKKLIKSFGEKEPIEKDLNFDYTDYYSMEMGKPLYRKYISFKKLQDIESLERIKIITNDIEKDLKKNGNRTVNLDPGYVTEAKLVLFTTKDYSHRLYIGENIFAEVTLNFQDGIFQALPWTYPDYRSNDAIEYFTKVRKQYMENIKILRH